MFLQRYEVQWYGLTPGSWRHYGYYLTAFGARRLACSKLANLINVEKWRVIDRQTQSVLYVFVRKLPYHAG